MIGNGLGLSVRRFLAGCFDMILPHRCLICGEEVVTAGSLCSVCWETVSFISPPWCARCGLPFEFDISDGGGEGKDRLLCPQCSSLSPLWKEARAAVRYAGGGRALVLKFKHGDRTDLAPVLAQWMKRAGEEILSEADVIVPVPLHRKRLFFRLYNQSSLLALHLQKQTGVPAAVMLLERRKATLSQGTFGRKGRYRNVQGAFHVSPRRRSFLEGKRVVLVDDVLTSGATVEACVRTLIRNGAACVSILTFARVFLEE